MTDLGFGSCSNLLKKAAERNKKLASVSTPSIVYEAALLRHSSRAENADIASLGSHNGGVLGYKSKEEALEAIRSAPLLEDVSLWTHWDDVFGGDVSKFGDLKSFLENEGILLSAGKSSSGRQTPLVVMETSPGVLLKVTTDTSPEKFKECACRGDAIGTAGHLVSMVMVNGDVASTPVALLANHVHSSLASMGADDKDDCDRRSTFVLECLARMPLKLARAIGKKVCFSNTYNTGQTSFYFSCYRSPHKVERHVTPIPHPPPPSFPSLVLYQFFIDAAGKSTVSWGRDDAK